MLPIRQTVALSGGHVTLQAWGANVADGYLIDLLGLIATLGEIRAQIQADDPAYSWEDLRRSDVERNVWAAFWRLVHASLDHGSTLPARLSWADRLTLLDAMYELNDLEATEGKWTGLMNRATRTLQRMQERQVQWMIQAPMTTRSTST